MRKSKLSFKAGNYFETHCPQEYLSPNNQGEGGSPRCACTGIQVSSNTVHNSNRSMIPGGFSDIYALTKGESWINWGSKWGTSE